MPVGDFNLNLRDGGDLTGGSVSGDSLNLGAQPADAPNLPSRLQTPAPAPPTRRPSLLEKPFEEFSTGDKLLWGLKSGLMGAGQAQAQKQEVMSAKARHFQQVTDLMIKGLNAVKNIEDVDQRARAGAALSKRIAAVGGASAAQSFKEIFDEPAVQDVIFSPETIQEFGSVQKAMAAREDDPKEFRARAVTANIGTIEEELLRLRETNPKLVQIDTNENGVVTSSEARSWVRKRIKAGDTNLSLKHMNVIEMPEFEPFLADIFEARTTTATAKAQEKDLQRAITREGKLVFVTEEEIRRDRSLTPEPKKPLVQFGGEKKDEALFDSLVKYRDDLRQQASGAQQSISLARTMRDTATRIQTGTGTETVADIKSTIGTIARIAGQDSIAEAVQNPALQDMETLRSLNSSAVSAMIRSEKAGSVSNEERRKFELQAPGLATTQGGNIALSHIMEAMGTSKVEEAAFVDSVTEQVARGQRRSDVGAQQAFRDYTRDLPYTKGDGSQIRFVDDGQKLWRYYLNGRPEKWVFPGGEFTIEEIKSKADSLGMSVREFLATADRKKTIHRVK